LFLLQSKKQFLWAAAGGGVLKLLVGVVVKTRGSVS